MVYLTHASREDLGENQGLEVDALILVENSMHGHMTDHLRTIREDAGKRVDEDMQEATSTFFREELTTNQCWLQVLLCYAVYEVLDRC